MVPVSVDDFPLMPHPWSLPSSTHCRHLPFTLIAGFSLAYCILHMLKSAPGDGPVKSRFNSVSPLFKIHWYLNPQRVFVTWPILLRPALTSEQTPSPILLLFFIWDLWTFTGKTWLHLHSSYLRITSHMCRALAVSPYTLLPFSLRSKGSVCDFFSE